MVLLFQQVSAHQHVPAVRNWLKISPAHLNENYNNSYTVRHAAYLITWSIAFVPTSPILRHDMMMIIIPRFGLAMIASANLEMVIMWCYLCASICSRVLVTYFTYALRSSSFCKNEYMNLNKNILGQPDLSYKVRWDSWSISNPLNYWATDKAAPACWTCPYGAQNRFGNPSCTPLLARLAYQPYHDCSGPKRSQDFSWWDHSS